MTKVKESKLPKIRDFKTNLRSAIKMMQLVKKAESEKSIKLLRMSTFQSPSNGDIKHKSLEALLHNCGSTACFAGFLAIYPPFIKQGLVSNYDGFPVLNGEGMMMGRLMKMLFGLDDDTGSTLCAVTSSGLKPTPHTCDQVIKFLKGELAERIEVEKNMSTFETA